MAEPRPLTWQQRKILAFIEEFTAGHGFSPTMREIGDATGLSSTSSVAWQLDVLEARGAIRRGPPAALVRLDAALAAGEGAA
jgi:repressor LexA